MLKRTLIIASTLAPSTLFAGSWGDLITSEGGAWDDDLCAIHLIHMPGGRFLVWGYGTANPAETDTWVWNSFTNTSAGAPPPPEPGVKVTRNSNEAPGGMESPETVVDFAVVRPPPIAPDGRLWLAAWDRPGNGIAWPLKYKATLKVSAVPPNALRHCSTSKAISSAVNGTAV